MKEWNASYIWVHYVIKNSLNSLKINSSSLNMFFNVQILKTFVTLSTFSLKLIDFHDCSLQTFKKSEKSMIFLNNDLSNSITASNSWAHLIFFNILMIIHSSINSLIMQSSQSDLIEKLKNFLFKNEKHAAVMFINSDVSLFNCKKLIMNLNDHITFYFSVSFLWNWTLRANLFVELLHCNFISFEQQSINEDHASLKKICIDWNNDHKNQNKKKNIYRFWFCCVFNVE